MVVKSVFSIKQGLDSYMKRFNKWTNHPNTLFDESYFLFILSTRYRTIFTKVVTEEEVNKVEERKQEVFMTLKQYFIEKRSKLYKISFFEKTQFWFNYVGFIYLESLEDTHREEYSIELTKKELAEITAGYGYSTIYDFMMTFFLQKLNQPIDIKGEMLPTSSEKIYIATHKFLLETDYFSKEVEVGENSIELLEGVGVGLATGNKDMLAEILWALNFFSVDKFPQRREIEIFLEEYLSNLKYVEENDLSREERHTLYSCILSFMEKKLKEDDKYG